MKTVTLQGGGTLTLSGNFNLFELSPTDRKVVFEIIDKMNEIEKTGGIGT